MLSQFFNAACLMCALCIQNLHANSELSQISQDALLPFAAQGNVQIVDVRTPREFNAGHIPGAINRPHKQIINGEINLNDLLGKKLVLYCHTGVRVGTVDQYLQRFSSFPRKDVLHLKGDFRAWQARDRVTFKSQ